MPKQIKEPYRIFFPIGLLYVILGIGVWVSFYFSPERGYPGIFHANILIRGFMLCFTIGFLCTMLPVRLELKPLPYSQFLVFLFCFLSLPLALLFNNQKWSASLVLAIFVNFFIFGISRIPYRKAPLPDPFIFLLGSMLMGMFVSIVLFLNAFEFDVNDYILNYSNIFMNHGFMLMLIMGIGSHLIGRIMKKENLSLPEEKKLSILLYSCLALVFLLSFALDTLAKIEDKSSYTRIAYLVRSCLFGFLFCINSRINEIPRGKDVNSKLLWLCVWIIQLGLILPIIDPSRLLAWQHIVFISGYTWITLIIASRVLTLHGGAPLLWNNEKIIAYLIAICILLSILHRVLPDLILCDRWFQFTLASLYLLIALILFIFRYGKYFYKNNSPAQ